MRGRRGVESRGDYANPIERTAGRHCHLLENERCAHRSDRPLGDGDRMARRAGIRVWRTGNNHVYTLGNIRDRSIQGLAGRLLLTTLAHSFPRGLHLILTRIAAKLRAEAAGDKPAVVRRQDLRRALLAVAEDAGRFDRPRRIPE